MPVRLVRLRSRRTDRSRATRLFTPHVAALITQPPGATPPASIGGDAGPLGRGNHQRGSSVTSVTDAMIDCHAHRRHRDVIRFSRPRGETRTAADILRDLADRRPA